MTGPDDSGARRTRRKPEWIRVARAESPAFATVRRTLRSLELGTVCEEARCPNRSECWSCGTATFLIMGRQCTRSCRFCSVRPAPDSGMEPLDPGEPDRVAEAVAALALRFAVITSVSRDDLPDGGAAHYAATIRAVKRRTPGAGVEVLTPDYLGAPLEAVLDAEPDVFAHNVEVVRELTPQVRDRRCSYDRSLEVLAAARRKRPSTVTKSSLLLGLGETDAQVEAALDDLRAVGVASIAIGQYLQPTRRNVPVERWVTPERFAELAALAREKGFTHVASGPLVRTSYHAAEHAGPRRPLQVLRLGRVPYEDALALQRDLAARRLAREIPDTVVVLEHPPVITLGHRADAGNVVAPAPLLRELGIAVHRVDRGGDVTYHGPGQVVMYPIVDLEAAKLGTARFVEILEECMIRAAARHGVEAARIPRKRGVFAGLDTKEKLGAVGIHVSHGVTTHGLALNVDPDLGHYALIVACGLREHGVTSLRRASGHPVDQRDVEDALIATLAELLGRTVENAT
jgi:lipoyl synthase